MNKIKGLLTKFSVALLIAVMIIPMFSIGAIMPVAAEFNGDDPDWYEVVNGVLTTDTYSLYPYEQKSLDIGFSKFGEMIGMLEWTTDHYIGVGLQYPGYDVVETYDQNEKTSADAFANERIFLKNWINGWLIDIKYLDTDGYYKEVWAMALFSDGDVPGKDWITMPSSPDPGVFYRPLWQEFQPFANPDAEQYGYNIVDNPEYFGGRKTNGIAFTDPIQVLYDGPRKYIALLTTHILDKVENPLVDVVFTIIFDKVEKHVIILKDVKILWDKSKLNIQFGNRGEWDLDLKGYVHFYTDEPVQVWDLDGNGTIEDEEVEQSTEFFRKWMVDRKYPKKWWQDVDWSQYPADLDGDGYVDDYERWVWRYEVHPDYFETQETTYTSIWHVDDNIKEHGYAVAQVIDKNLNYVGAMAVWPHPEFWSVQSFLRREYKEEELNIPLIFAPLSRMLDWNKWTEKRDPHGYLDDMPNLWIKIDDFESPLTEPGTPWLIYEHDFELEKEVVDQYRVVSVYVLTDLHDGDDADMGAGHVNLIDREIQYNLDEIFNSWDLRKAMHKPTKRWVQLFEGDGGTYWYDFDWERQVEKGKWEWTIPVAGLEGIYGEWDQYCVPSERVIVYGTGVITPARNIAELQENGGVGGDWYSYPYTYTIGAYGPITFYKDVDGDREIDFFGEVAPGYEEYWKIPDGVTVKVLWSSPNIHTKAEQWPWWEVWEWPPMSAQGYVPGILPLHHSVVRRYDIKWLETEVFWENTPPPPMGPGEAEYLIHGEWVANEWTECIYLQDPPECRYLWVEGDYPGVVILDSFGEGPFIPPENEFRTKYWVPYEPWDVRCTRLNETFFDVTEWETLVPEPEVGDWTDDWDVFEPGGIIVDIDYGDEYTGPYGDLIEVEIIYPEWYLYWGDYVIHETHTCDELVLDTRQEMPDAFEGVELDWGAGVEVDEVEADSPDPDEEWPWYQWPMLKIVYKVWGGRYEWGIVGKDAFTVDSAGIGMVTAAIKNKNLEFGITGLDISETIVAAQIPWVFRKFGPGMDVTDYHYDHPGGDHRTALKDHWCPQWVYDEYYEWWTTHTGWPISSSNMIGVGGPIANLLAYYGNDFTEAFYGDPRFTPADSLWYGSIAALTCWSKGDLDMDGVGDYASSEEVGYAVITTTKDKNNTILLLIWGHWGRDTYYASRWFEYNKYWLQHINQHVTSLILEIDYYDPEHPEIKIVEKLGTISEKPVHQDP